MTIARTAEPKIEGTQGLYVPIHSIGYYPIVCYRRGIRTSRATPPFSGLTTDAYFLAVDDIEAWGEGVDIVLRSRALHAYALNRVNAVRIYAL